MSVRSLRPCLPSPRLSRFVAGIGTILLLAGMPAAATAAPAKPPKTVCVHFDLAASDWALTTKAIGKVTTAAGKVTLYDVSAAANYGAPWAGSGFMQGTVLHATLSTRFSTYNYQAEIHWDTATSTGTASYSIAQDSGSVDYYSVTLSPVDCSTLTILGAP